MYKITIYRNKKREFQTIYCKPIMKEALKLLNELKIEDFYEIKIVKKDKKDVK